jgi:hypothetical protein
MYEPNGEAHRYHGLLQSSSTWEELYRASIRESSMASGVYTHATRRTLLVLARQRDFPIIAGWRAGGLRCRSLWNFRHRLGSRSIKHSAFRSSLVVVLILESGVHLRINQCQEASPAWCLCPHATAEDVQVHVPGPAARHALIRAARRATVDASRRSRN